MAALAPPWWLPLLVFLLTLTIPQASAALNDASQLSCFYNSKANISCVWSREGALWATPCHIHAQSDSRPWNRTCELLPVGQEALACNLILGASKSQALTSADIVNISMVCWEGERWRMVATQKFKPFDNLRPLAPNSLQVTSIETHRCNITWSVSQISHYIVGYLEFEARTRSPGQSWEEASLLSLKQPQYWICLETLTPDTPYELQVRVRARRGSHRTWSPWSQPLAFRTKPAAAPENKALPLPWLGLGVVLCFLFSVYFLANCRYIRPWLKTVLKCHIPDPSEFFSQLSSQHGGDLQKWLSSPFPSASFSPGGPAPEISPLEVLDRDPKAMQLLALRQDKVSSPSPSGHSQTSCFTNQGYFFFQLPDALEIEACQVYFTYDPCLEEEPELQGPAPPLGSPLPPAAGDEDAYCTFPPGDHLLLFSPGLLGSPSPKTAHGGRGGDEERLPRLPQDGCCQPLGPPAPVAPGLEQVLGEMGEEGPACSPGEGTHSPEASPHPPEASPPRQCQGRAPTSGPALDTDAYLSLQELLAQGPGHLL